jgi:hypothetical protein
MKGQEFECASFSGELAVIGEFTLESGRIQRLEEQGVRRDGEMVKLSGRLWHVTTFDIIPTRAREARGQHLLAGDSPTAPRNFPLHRGALRGHKRGANRSFASGHARSSSRCAFATAGAASGRSTLSPPPAGVALLIIADFPALFAEFCGRRCRVNTLPPILDTEGDIFGSFTRAELELPEPIGMGRGPIPVDPRRKRFLSTLKNPCNFPMRKLLKAGEKN